MKKIEVGQSIWVKEGYSSKDLTETKVTKVSKKYFYASRNKFDLNTLRTNEYPYYYAYLSEQDHLDELEAQKLRRELSYQVDKSSVRLDILKAIKALLFPKPNKLVCSCCGSDNVQVSMWVNPNTKIIGDSNEASDDWCEDCQDHVILKLKD